jgi:hypothetical protein
MVTCGMTCVDRGFELSLGSAYCALTDCCEVEGIEAAQMTIDLDAYLVLLC